jgi:RNA polymerase sigma-70 factor (ECF subfamily)
MRFAPYQKRLFGYALALAHDRDAAAELVQDCVVKAIEARSVPRDEPAYRAWLFAILRNLWLDRLRKARLRAGENDPPSDDAASLHCFQEEVTLNVIAVRQAFERLTPEHRDILALVDVGGFGYKEASEILGLPEGTVMSRVSRARSALCRLLSDGAVRHLPAIRRTAPR